MSANQIITDAYDYIQTTSTVNVATAGNAAASYGYLRGIFVSSVSGSPTITIYDDPAAGTAVKIVDTFAPVAGQFYSLPTKYKTGCNVVIVATCSVTIFFNRP